MQDGKDSEKYFFSANLKSKFIFSYFLLKILLQLNLKTIKISKTLQLN